MYERRAETVLMASVIYEMFNPNKWVEMNIITLHSVKGIFLKETYFYSKYMGSFYYS